MGRIVMALWRGILWSGVYYDNLLSQLHFLGISRIHIEISWILEINCASNERKKRRYWIHRMKNTLYSHENHLLHAKSSFAFSGDEIKSELSKLKKKTKKEQKKAEQKQNRNQ